MGHPKYALRYALLYAFFALRVTLAAAVIIAENITSCAKSIVL